MDELENELEELASDFVKNQQFPNMDALLMYIEGLEEIHRDDNCEECLETCNENNNGGSDVHTGTENINIEGSNHIKQSSVVSAFSGNSFIQGNSCDKQPRLSRRSRKSVCVVPKLRYSSGSSDSDIDNNDNKNSDIDDEVIIRKSQLLPKLNVSSDKHCENDNNDNGNCDIDDEVIIRKIQNSNKDGVEADENCLSSKLHAVQIDSSADDDSLVIVRTKKNICKVSSSDSDARGSKKKSASCSTDHSSSTDDASEDEDNAGNRSDTIRDKVFDSSSDDDFDEDKYKKFLSTCKESKKSRTSVDDDSCDDDDDDDSYDSDSFIVKDTKSTKKMKKPLDTKVTNIMTPKPTAKNTIAKKVMTPMSSIRGILASLPTPKSVPGTPAYKRYFNKTKESVVKELFKNYNETVFDNRLPADFQVTWNKRMTKTAGFCYLSKSLNNRTSRIELSDKVIDSVERIRDTLIHEMCHAATWIFEGKRGHGLEWKYWAKKANKKHPDLPIVTTCHNYEIQTKYQYQCDGCGQVYGRHTKSINEEKHACGKCGGRPLLISDSKSASKTPRKPNAYMVFVKENFSVVKKRNPALSHKELMKKVAEEFREKRDSESNKENALT